MAGGTFLTAPRTLPPRAQSVAPDVRLFAAWVLKNMLYHSSKSVKDEVLQDIPLSSIMQLGCHALSLWIRFSLSLSCVCGECICVPEMN